MDFISKLLGSVTALAQGAGSVIDAAVPVANGDRTKISALIAVASPVLCSATAPFSPAACGVIQSIGTVAATLLPLFAFAGVVRAK